jgi:hypothetical protein
MEATAMRRITTIWVLGAAVAPWALPLGASCSGEPAKGPKVITVRGEITGTHAVDSPPAGPSAGDHSVFTEDLFGTGRRIGRTTGSCVVITPPASFQCTAIASLPEGQLTLLANIAEGPATGAITGGTGRYRKARGTFRVEPIGEGRERITYRVFD